MHKSFTLDRLIDRNTSLVKVSQQKMLKGGDDGDGVITEDLVIL